jgi:hypothetical protein
VRASGGCRRSISSTATSRPDQGRTFQEPQHSVTKHPEKGDTIPQSTPVETETVVEVTEIVHITYKVGDKVVYPHHGAGKVLKKE